MKSAFFLVLGLIFGLVIAGIATLRSEVVLLSIPLLAYLFASILGRPEAVTLAFNREVTPDFVPEGTPISVRLTITNQGEALPEVSIQDVLPRGVAILDEQDGQTAVVRTLEAQGKIELAYTITAQRGTYDAYEVSVSARDTFGLFEQPSIYGTKPHFVAHPRYPKLDRVRIRPPQTRGFAGPIASRQGGSGIGFWGVREYQTGDSPRQINWKLAARSYQDLYTNIFEQERIADVGLILDARQLTNSLTSDGSLFEHSNRAVAALAEDFLKEGNRVSLLVYGSAVTRVFPGYGRRQRERILRTLSRVTPGLNYAMENLANLPTRIFPPKSQIVLVSPLVPEDIAVIARMRAQGYAVFVISPDPVSYESARYQDFTSPAYKIAFAERLLMLNQMQRSGVHVVNWRVDQPLEIAIRQVQARAAGSHRPGL